jgi:hypothetical protein
MENNLANTVHVFMQSKGGSGKTFGALFLAQYLESKGNEIACFDTDPSNKTFSRFKSLHVNEVSLLEGRRIVENNNDTMLDDILKLKNQIVIIDTGSSNFHVTTSYFLENDVFNLLNAHGKKVVLHIPINGGTGTTDTVESLVSIYDQFKSLNFDIVVWQNDVHGVIALKEFQIYSELMDSGKLLGIVDIRVSFDEHGVSRQDSFGSDLRRFMTSFLTIPDLDAATKFSDGTAIDVMKKHRIHRIFSSVVDQLNAVFPNSNTLTTQE